MAGTYKGDEVQCYLRLIVHNEMYESPVAFCVVLKCAVIELQSMVLLG